MAKKGKKIKFSDLSAEAKAIVEKKTVKERRSFKEWQRLLNELAEFDQVTDALAGRAGCIGGGAIVLAVVGLIALIPIADAPRIAMMIDGGVIAVAVIAAVIFLSRRSYLKKFDLMNDLRVVLTPTLDALAEDVDPKTRVEMVLDLRGLVTAKQLSSEKLPPGRFRELTKTVFQDPWLSLTLELADGNQANLVIKNYFVKIHREWRNPRGKTKTKDKWCKRVVVAATVVPQREGLTWDRQKAATGPAGQKVKWIVKKGVPICRLARKFKFKEVNKQPEQSADAQEIIGMFMQLYSMLSMAGKRS